MHFHGIVSGSLQTHYNSKTKQKTQDETRWLFKYFTKITSGDSQHIFIDLKNIILHMQYFQRVSNNISCKWHKRSTNILINLNVRSVPFVCIYTPH